MLDSVTFILTVLQDMIEEYEDNGDGLTGKHAPERDECKRLRIEDEEVEMKKRHKHGRSLAWSLYWAFAAEACAAVILTAIFNTFHVEVFLTEYKLSLSVYASGHAIYAVINTLNDIVGAYMLDVLAFQNATKGRGRAWLLKWGGQLWAVAFLMPWFRWKSYPALHFVVSLSCYDTMYSFCAIAGGSLLTEMDLTDTERIQVSALIIFYISCMNKDRVFHFLLYKTLYRYINAS